MEISGSEQEDYNNYVVLMTKDQWVSLCWFH